MDMNKVYPIKEVKEKVKALPVETIGMVAQVLSYCHQILETVLLIIPIVNLVYLKVREKVINPLVEKVKNLFKKQ